jgi:Flp pilus assembly secretin CpaC
MRSNIWKKSIPIMVTLFIVLSFVNIVGAFDAYSDMAITSKVEAKLQSDSQLNGSRIIVDTKNGEVTLKGLVNSQADITRAAKLASYVDGVKHVDNRLSTETSHHYPLKPGMTDCQIGANWC